MFRMNSSTLVGPRSPRFRCLTADLRGIGFAAADDQHVRHFLHLRLADLEVHLLVAVIDSDPHARGLELLRNFMRVRRLLIGDRQNGRLHRREPHRKRARIVLDQNAEESLDRSEQRAMHHHRTMLLAVFGDVFQLKPARQSEIELHGGKLP